ncbi:MAG: class I SAM-dependent methyltransferase [Deltaproteobacteria bacterium]|nr:MAG: class I SAM-dependent methyltransferase [Deltaproteobacteria bacterium]
MPWAPRLALEAASFRVWELFPGLPALDTPVDALPRGTFVDSPGGTFRYCVRLHRKGMPLQTFWQDQVGTVVFDGDVAIPALYEKDPRTGRFGPHPWMSLTPSEIMTLRAGTRLAKGHVVVAGLGLGHQLLDVARRIQVKRITLVERSAELVDWLLPVLRPRLRKPLRVVVGDAFEALPRIAADIALVDIYPEYGGNRDATLALARACPKIRRFWGWGDAPVTGLGQRGTKGPR